MNFFNKKIKPVKIKKWKRIKYLTPEQRSQMAVYAERFKKIALNTDPVDKKKAEEAVKNFYKFFNFSEPIFEWVDNPIEGAKRAAQEATGQNEVSAEEIKTQIRMAIMGSFEACYLPLFVFINDMYPIESFPLLNIIVNLVENCGIFWMFDGLVIMTDRPKVLKINEKGEVHSTEGYAIDYGNWGIYSINGEIQKNLSDTILKGFLV